MNYEPRGGVEEVQMEPVDPSPSPPEDPIVPVSPEDPVARRSTRVTRPCTRYPTEEYDLT